MIRNNFLDCGAPHLYNEFVRKFKNKNVKGASIADRQFDDFSFTETDFYKQYRNNYICFIQEYGKYITQYSNLDVINNPEKTWENQQILEKEGLHPIPVYHFGCDIKWLKHYLDKGYDYIAIGGMIPNPTSVLIPALDEIWSNYLTDQDGMPLVKIHGFALTSSRLMVRYPWFSVDSTSWVLVSAYGRIFVPVIREKKPIYNGTPWIVALSSRSPTRKDLGKHLSTYSPMEQDLIMGYIRSKGFDLGKSEYKEENRKTYKLKEGEYWFNKQRADELGDQVDFCLTANENENLIEVIVERGLSNDYVQRDEMNIIYFTDFQKSQPPWPYPFKLKQESKTTKIKGFGLK